MIITELTDQVEAEMDALVRQGVTSFKLFMAYPGVFMLDDASIFKALLRTGKNGGSICMHAENGGVIDVLVQRALAEGKTAPKYHALTRPARAEAEATHRAIALAEIADVRTSSTSAAEAPPEMVTEARSRPAGVPETPAVPVLSHDNREEPGFTAPHDEPAASHPPNSIKAARPGRQRSQVIPTDHRPFRTKEQKELGPNDFPRFQTARPASREAVLVYDGGVATGRITSIGLSS
jgi:dihydropyrimidinase